jgi:hypothetical protein
MLIIYMIGCTRAPSTTGPKCHPNAHIDDVLRY